MFDPHEGCTSTIMASLIFNLALAYIPFSGVLHVKGRFLPKELLTSAGNRRALALLIT
jgi:hypothetical protein